MINYMYFKSCENPSECNSPVMFNELRPQNQWCVYHQDSIAMIILRCSHDSKTSIFLKHKYSHIVIHHESTIVGN